MELKNTMVSTSVNRANPIFRSIELTTNVHSYGPSTLYYQPWNSYHFTTPPPTVNHTERSPSSVTSPESSISSYPSLNHSLSPTPSSIDMMPSPTISCNSPFDSTVPNYGNRMMNTSTPTSMHIYPCQFNIKTPNFKETNNHMIKSDRETNKTNDSGNSSSLSSNSSPSPRASISHPTISPPVSPKSYPIPEDIGVKKNSRTNYSPQQIRTLEKIFLETPYPEIDVIEQLSTDLSIPEKNLKIWFQNKRARWRKRVQNNKPTFPPVYPCYPASVPSTVSPYNMMSPSSLMSSFAASEPISRSVYNLPLKPLPVVSTPSHLYPAQINPYAYPYMFSQLR